MFRSILILKFGNRKIDNLYILDVNIVPLLSFVNTMLNLFFGVQYALLPVNTYITHFTVMKLHLSYVTCPLEGFMLKDFKEEAPCTL